ncbi:MAG: coenzyme F420-0:L-glutamate ligase [Cellvibrionales bacterium]|nr:coenzyme F420-0:L-glutamate ligase [Cellvibrionales bacterium]
MECIAVKNFPEVLPGDDLAALLIQSLEHQGLVLGEGDIVAMAQKIVSKAENRYAVLDEVKPSDEALALAKEIDKDPSITQLILDESVEIVRKRPGVVIVEHNQGYVHANAGIDRSNLPASNKERVLLLPVDANKSASELNDRLSWHFGCQLGVIINDSAGRAWRNGTQGFAIGIAGFNPLIDLIGKPDRSGRVMETTQVAVGDELAAAASFIMGQADEGTPVVVIKGAKVELGVFDAKCLIREKRFDLFR